MYVQAAKKAHATATGAKLELRALYDEAGEAELTAEQRSTETSLQSTIRDAEAAERDALDGLERAQKLDEARSRFEGTLKAGDEHHEDEQRNAEGGNERVPGQYEQDLANVLRMAKGEIRSLQLNPAMRGDGDAADEARAIIEGRDLLAGTATDGAELVPTSLYSEIIRLVEERSSFGSMVRNLTTTGGGDIDIPRVTSNPQLSWVSEAGNLPESDPQFETVTIGAHKAAFLTQVSSELLADSAFNVASFLAEVGADAIGDGVTSAIIAGDGSGKPTGLIGEAAKVTSAAVDSITADELIDLQHSIVSGYRGQAVWLMNDATLAAVRKLKDADGQYLWAPGLTMGRPDSLLGRPVYTDPNVPVMAASATPVAFGDPNGYLARYAGGIRVEQSEHFAFANDLVTWRFLVRVDGRVIDSRRFAVLANAA